MNEHAVALDRRTALGRLASVCAIPLLGARTSPTLGRNETGPIIVYKRVGCMCCTSWVEHLQSAGLDAHQAEETDLDLIKDRLGIPASLRGCHTAVVQGYVVEGHVPADLIARLLEEKPEVAGLAVPGMPVGSPGMEMDEGTTTPYDIISFRRDGSSTVFASRG